MDKLPGKFLTIENELSDHRNSSPSDVPVANNVSDL